MKTNFLKTSISAFMVLAFAAFTMTSCQKDDDAAPKTIKSQIVGTWNFTSYKVDTSEYMGSLVDTARITFDAFTTGTQGNFKETIVWSDGEKDNLTGKYEVDEAGKKVKLVVTGKTETIDVTLISGTKLEWKGKEGSKNVTVKTVRK